MSDVKKHSFKFCGLLRIYELYQVFNYSYRTILSIPEIEKIELHVCYFCFYITKVQNKQKQRLTMEDLTTIENWIWLKCMNSQKQKVKYPDVCMSNVHFDLIFAKRFTFAHYHCTVIHTFKYRMIEKCLILQALADFVL